MYINSLNSIERGFGLAQIDNRKFIWPAIIAGAAALGSTIISAVSNHNNNKRQEQLVQNQNAYNTSAQQVDRLRQAGLNPYMMLGQVNSGNQQSIASTNAMDYSNAGAQIGAAAQMAQQQPLIKAQVRATHADAENKEADTEIKRIDASTELETRMADIEKQLAEKNLTEEQRKKLEEERKILEEQHAELVRQVKVQNDNTEADTGVKNAQEKNTTEDTRGKKLHNDADAKWLDSDRAFQQRLMRSQEAGNYAGALLSRSSAETNRQMRPYQVGLTKSQMYGQHWSNRLAGKNFYWQPRLWSKQSDAIDAKIAQGWVQAGTEVFHEINNTIKNVNDAEQKGKYGKYGKKFQKR